MFDVVLILLGQHGKGKKNLGNVVHEDPDNIAHEKS